MVFLGDISYSIYLLHWELVRVRRIADARLAPYLDPATADACGLVVFFLVLLGCSWFAYRFVEKPGRRILRRAERLVTRGSEPRPVASPDTAAAASS
jgi:peptidoglycan/LPS O-acetylase OafA/YrhL